MRGTALGPYKRGAQGRGYAGGGCAEPGRVCHVARRPTVRGAQGGSGRARPRWGAQMRSSAGKGSMPDHRLQTT
eukprot:8481089-Lingulodinium_polyedra.AAC.1